MLHSSIFLVVREAAILARPGTGVAKSTKQPSNACRNAGPLAARQPLFPSVPYIDFL
jgi:hypothetical protein